MPNNTIVSNLAFAHSKITSSNLISITQKVLSILGFDDKSYVILEANQQYQLSRSTLLNAIKNYAENPKPHSAENLLKSLDAELKRIIHERNLVKRKQENYQKAASKETKTPSNWSYAHRLLHWVYKEGKHFFGSDNANLAKHYAEIAKQREMQIDALQQYRDNLIKTNIKVQGSQQIIPTQYPSLQEIQGVIVAALLAQQVM
jgi:hypothetical protein